MKIIRIPIKKEAPDDGHGINLEKEYAEYLRRAHKKWPSKRATAKSKSKWHLKRKIRSQF